MTSPLTDFLKTDDKHFSYTSFFLLLIIAYAFSIAIRMIWVYQFADMSEFYWNGQLMINTNDGYAYAEGARDMLAGFHQDNDLSYYGTALSTITYLLAKIVPVSFETLILYMPAVFGSLLVIPVLLIARLLKQDIAGFIAALLAGITWSYYNRTMTGYYDTDMLTIVLPTFILWALLLNIQKQRNRYLLLIPIFITLYSWWYGQSYSLNLAMGGMVLLYTLLFARSNLFHYKMLIFILLAIGFIPWYFKLGLSLLLFGLFHFVPKTNEKSIILALLAAALALVAITGGLTPVFSQINGYIFREAIAAEPNLNLHFYNVTQTVREAGQIPFETFANRISGHTITFILSIIGYIMLALRYRIMWLGLPMIGLGFIALSGGLRFTVYAVPVMALGIGYLVVWMAQQLERFIFIDKTLLVARILFIILALSAVLYPNITHVIGYKVPTVFNKTEVQILDNLGKMAQREDYVITWWDYGYPIRYYSDVKTLVDGGKHTGKDNFPVSFALTYPPLSAANMSRFSVEYTEKSYKEGFHSILAKGIQDYNATSIESFLTSLGSDLFKAPEPTRDIYFYLPLRMLEIFPTVGVFSNIDLHTGEAHNRPFFYHTAYFEDKGNMLFLGNGIALDKNTGVLKVGNQQTKLAQFVSVQFDAQGNVQKNSQTIDPQAELSLIYMKSYNQFLLLDQRLMNSLYIRLFILEDYDPALFEKVINSPYAKVFKLKR